MDGTKCCWHPASILPLCLTHWAMSHWVMSHWVMSQALSDCRMKRVDILQSAEAAKEGVQKRVREQEVSVEHRLDELETSLQVRLLPMLSSGVHGCLSRYPLQSALGCIWPTSDDCGTQC